MTKTDEKVSGLHDIGAKTSEKIESVLTLVDESRAKMEDSSNVVNVQVEKL